VFGVMYDQGASTDGTYYYIPIASAQLRNGDGSMLDTTGAEAGTTYQVCSTCGCWYTGECEACSDPCAAGHTPGAEADCENAQTCTVCGEVLKAALGHTPGAEADCENAQTCTVCGEVLKAALGHTPGAEADCENAQTCTVCGEVLKAALGHTPGAEADCENAQTCTVCGEVLKAALGHTPGAEADCENAQTCTVCGEVLKAALGHTPGAEADCENAQTCTVCGEVLKAALGHSHVGVVTAPDCENGGYTTYTCSACGDSYVADHTDALGHSHVGVETQAPTCGVDGVTTYTCSACGDSYTEAIPATGAHIYDHEFDVDCNVCGGIREVELPINFDGKSVSEDVSGLAFKFTLPVVGMGVDKTTAVYEGATLNGYKLLEMGATVSNSKSSLKLAVGYLFDLSDATASYAVRVINIPVANHDSEITAVPYFVVEIDGQAVTIEGEAQTGTYNGVLNR